MDVRQRLFAYRSYTPIPFLIVMILFAHPTLISIVTGGIVALAGEFLRLWGVAIAGSETRTTGPVGGTFLITTGPFAYVRNPLYLGNMLLYVGASIMANAFMPWLPLVAFTFFFIQYMMIVSLEEQYLEKTFGDEFDRYCLSVPRFFPTPRPYRAGTSVQPELDWKRGFVSERRTLQAIAILAIVLIGVAVARG